MYSFRNHTWIKLVIIHYLIEKVIPKEAAGKKKDTKKRGKENKVPQVKNGRYAKIVWRLSWSVRLSNNLLIKAQMNQQM